MAEGGRSETVKHVFVRTRVASIPTDDMFRRYRAIAVGNANASAQFIFATCERTTHQKKPAEAGFVLVNRKAVSGIASPSHN